MKGTFDKNHKLQAVSLLGIRAYARCQSHKSSKRGLERTNEANSSGSGLHTVPTLSHTLHLALLARNNTRSKIHRKTIKIWYAKIYWTFLRWKSLYKFYIRFETIQKALLFIRRDVDESEAINMIKWFIKNYKGEVTSHQFRTFFPAIGTGQHLSDMVFRSAEGTKIYLSSCVYFYIFTGIYILQFSVKLLFNVIWINYCSVSFLLFMSIFAVQWIISHRNG